MNLVREHSTSCVVVAAEAATPSKKPEHLFVQAHSSIISPGTERTSLTCHAGSIRSINRLVTGTRVTLKAIEAFKKEIPVDL